MAHNLNYNEKTEKYSFFSTKEKAWHNLGTIVQDYPTSAEAIKFAGLDYVVEKRPLFTVDKSNLDTFKDPDADDYFDELTAGILVPNYFATLRTDTDDVLGVVGKDYEIVQNVQAFDFFDSIVGGGEGILYETAGALGKGERIFITAKLPDYIRVGRNDCIEKYLFLTTSHDGLGSITAAFTPIRIVCNNTLNAAMRNKTNCIRIKHTSNVQYRLKIAHTLLGLTNQLANELEQVYNNWATIRITDSKLKELIQVAMSPNKETTEALRSGQLDEFSTLYKNTVENVLEYAMSSPSQQQETTKGTLFGAYNSITGYYQNVCNYKDDESKLKSIMYGTGLKRGQKAFDLCTDFAKNGNTILSEHDY
ncbi:MAG: DUF932 domain-containing protein [Candidatus Pedobacter colombiensis]|uniref:DUF932 domain-containing protein n=1 Tax=Candidatus Pedobacter colombiensis TaxID=3121371 RepID=A0AAJ6B7A0_9SPHI|nr:DUF932 domain-containing protein [Pedobacter sp.]WEK17853.1 MAG: DUF932 domain-containing protein [Pedobacter sp.]